MCLLYTVYGKTIGRIKQIYIFKYIKYTPTYFVKSCSYQAKLLMASHIAHEISEQLTSFYSSN